MIERCLTPYENIIDHNDVDDIMMLATHHLPDANNERKRMLVIKVAKTVTNKFVTNIDLAKMTQDATAEM